jgi:hypothetical protein
LEKIGSRVALAKPGKAGNRGHAKGAANDIRTALTIPWKKRKRRRALAEREIR